MKKPLIKKRKSKIVEFTGLYLLVIILLAALQLDGQITINQSDMPVPGDTLRKSLALNVWDFDFEETGADFTWDFSGLQPLSQTVDTFLKVTETPVVYWPFFLLSANMASPQPVPDFEQLPLEEVYDYYNNTENNYAYVGYAATVYGIPLPFKFNNADILYDFPLDYGNQDSSNSGFQFSIPDLAFLMIDRHRVNTVDGWGTLITPFGTFETLRLKSEVSEYDSIYLDTLGIGFPVNQVYTEYKWLAKGQKIPLLEATQSLLGVVAVYRDSIRDLSVGIADTKKIKPVELTLFPNPVTNRINIMLPELKDKNARLMITGLNGKVYFEKKLTETLGQKRLLILKLLDYGLSSGQYILSVSSSKELFTSGFIFLPNN